VADYSAVNGAARAEFVTFTAGAAITGGQLLVFSAADTVSPAAANAANWAGVAAHDAASGAPVTVIMGAGVIHETVQSTGGAINAGDLLYIGAAAKVIKSAGTGYSAVAIGVALRTAADGAALRWKTLTG
jgi:Uncharacterized conserved protein (DUF2190)